ncbi:phosphonate C-P lyase system protein PhnL [Alsobacter sp. KACC 23698]|uniref:Phosphonate C-P lyase system protein PhnL n=1 Tax=Alsobacter sp. KACC 23698 TaxID=3149229 RepID=A0AAU7JKJ1_9HYPH
MESLSIDRVGKTFTMHLQGGARLPVVRDVSLAVSPGECVVLGGPSGAGKSSLLKIVYGNYRCDDGHVWVRDGDHRVDVARAAPRRVLRLRRTTLGYVSQFLRVIPRVSALDLVAQAAVEQGASSVEAAERAAALLERLNVPRRLWTLPPATFSGGEQQRVNIARGFVAEHPVLLLDEPTASLDARNRAAVVELIHGKKRRGVAILGIFHDEDVRDRVADRVVDVTRFSAAA